MLSVDKNDADLITAVLDGIFDDGVFFTPFINVQFCNLSAEKLMSQWDVREGTTVQNYPPKYI